MFPRIARIGLPAALACAIPSPYSMAEGGERMHAERIEFSESFEDGWRDRWQERRLAYRATRYGTVREGDDQVLRADSRGAASGLWREAALHAPRSGRVAWRWRVDRGIEARVDEREKSGDDFAARLFVVFGGEFPSRDNRALCYVWAAGEPAGSVYRSPYADQVAMIVVASGGAGTGEWRSVERDFIADYRAVFGEEPLDLSGVALMVDTDNTGSEVRTFFDDVTLEADGTRPSR